MSAWMNERMVFWQPRHAHCLLLLMLETGTFEIGADLLSSQSVF